MDEASRPRWTSRLSFTLAAAGSAVGLGNLWKFPYITWDHGGGAFVLVYLVCIAALGFPLMTAEILIGCAAQRSAVDAFARLGGRAWSAVGWLGVFTSVLVFSFYAVVAGWSVYSLVRCLRWSFRGYVAPPPEAFGAFMANGPVQVGLGFGFIALTAGVVILGVRAGIDRMARVLMPALFAILIYMLITSLTLPGVPRGLAYLVHLDFSAIDREAVLVALGHAFFTLSVGIGAMIAYGSYLGGRERILGIAATVTALDTIAALMACAILFPIIFSVPELEAALGDDREVSSVSMLFVTLPDLFYRHLPGGIVVAPLFFALVAFAALSSTVPPLELITTTVMERGGWRRPGAALAASGVVSVGMIACALSLGAVPWLSSVQVYVAGSKAGVLAIFDHLAANWLLPLGGLATCIFAGWVLPESTVAEHLGSDESGAPSRPARIWRFFARWVCPAGIGWILISVIRGTDFS